MRGGRRGLPLWVAGLTCLLAGVCGCADESDAPCGEGEAPVVVTGLNGLLDGATPAVEILARVPRTCEVTDRTWAFFDDETETVTLGDEPTSGVLGRDAVDVDDRTIFFRDRNVGVRLDYPGDDVGPALSLVWFSMGEELAAVDCAADAEALRCAVAEP